MNDDELKDAARGAFESAMAFGVDRHAFEKLARTVRDAEREACAKIADDRAMGCEQLVALAGDSDEATELRSLAWPFSVLAAEMRKRSNAK